MARSLLPRLKKLFADKIIVRKKLSEDGMGSDPTYASATTYRARVIGQQKLVKTPTGKEVMSNVTVWIWGKPELGYDDKFTLPERFSPREPRPLAIDNFSDENKAHHVKVYF